MIIIHIRRLNMIFKKMIKKETILKVTKEATVALDLCLRSFFIIKVERLFCYINSNEIPGEFHKKT